MSKFIDSNGSEFAPTVFTKWESDSLYVQSSRLEGEFAPWDGQLLGRSIDLISGDIDGYFAAAVSLGDSIAFHNSCRP